MSAHQSRRPRKLQRALVVSGLAFLVTIVPAAMYGLPVSAASTSATLQQCDNGGVGPPISLQQCAGSGGGGGASILNGQVSSSGYGNWGRGNSSGSNSHWREGDFISYRMTLSDTPGTYTASLLYDTVHSGGHAIDYLGSYDASETTSTACPQSTSHTFTTSGCPAPPGFHANYNNPCADLGMPSSDCANNGTAPAPRSTAAIPGTCPASETNANCTSVDNETAISQGATCGGSGSSGAVANGTFAQTPGTFDLFGPSGSKINSVQYMSQNVLSGTGTCQTTINVNFTLTATAGSSQSNSVLAWGGHIASSGDWGSGNSAASINGSPYHMQLSSCGCGTGNQSLPMATSAVFFPTSTATQLSASTASVGGQVSDTGTVTGAAPDTAGTVTFTVYTNNTCTTAATTGSSGQISAQPGQVTATNNGSGTLTASSPSVTFNQGGTYYWQAAFAQTGGNATALPSTSPCTSEQLTVSSPSLTLTKTADASSVTAGQQIGFKVKLVNGGVGSANGITLSDNLPSGTGLNWSLDTAGSTIPSGISCAVTGTAPTQALSCGTSPSTSGTFSLAGGATLLLHVTSGTTASSCSTTAYTNVASFTSTNAGSGSQQASVTVNCPSGTPTKTADAATVNAGQQIGFKITVPNAGPGDLTSVTLSDSLPTGSGLNWSLDTAGSTIPSGISCAISGTAPAQQTLTCGTSPNTTGTFTVAAGTTLLLHVTSPTVGGASCTTTTYTNTVNITTGNGGNANPQAMVTVNCPSGTPTKTADAATVNAGQQIGFKITIPNGGPGDLTGVTLNDPLPLASGFNWSLDATGSTIPSGISCAISGTAPAQQTLSCGTSPSTTGTFTVKASTTLLLHVVSPTTSASCSTTPYTNTATITTTNGGNSSPSATVTVNCPSGTPTKTADAATVNAGQQIGFKITIPNGGPGDLTGVTLNDPLPLASGFNWTLDTAGSTIPSGISCAISGTAPAQQTLSCGTSPSTTGMFTVKASTTLLLHVTSPTTSASCSTTPYTNTATITTTNGGNSSPSATVTVNCPNGTPTKTADAATVNAGQQIGFKITIPNAGPGDLTAVTLSDQLPLSSGLNWSLDTGGSTIPSGISCAISGTAPAQQTLSCGTSPSTTGTFTVKAGTTLLLHVTSPTVGGASCTTTTYTNTVNITTGNGGNANPQAMTTANCPSGTPTKTADASSVNAGQQIGFKVTIPNGGPGDLTGVTLNDSLPLASGFNWSLDTTGSTIPSGISCAISGTAPAQQTLSCGTSPSTTGTFTVKASTTLLLHVTSPTTAASCSTTPYTNTATITTGNGGNSSPSATVTVNCPSGTPTKTADAATVNAGQQIGFKITVPNGGPGDLTSVTLSDSLPTGSGLSWSLDTSGSTIPSGISCTISGTAPAQQTLTCGTSPSTTGTFTVKAGTTLLLHVTSPTVGGANCTTTTYTNTVNITTGNGGNANPQAQVTVNCPSGTPTKTADAATVNAGQQIGFKITVPNGGPGDLTGVTLSDQLPLASGLNWSLDTAGSTIPSGISCAISGTAPAQQTLSCGTSPSTTGTFTVVAGTTLLLHVTSPTVGGTTCTTTTYTNTVNITTGNGGNANPQAMVTVNCPSGTPTKTADAATVNGGQQIGFKITIPNSGSGDLTGVTLNDPLPLASGFNWSLDTAGSTIPAGISCAVSGTAPAQQTLTCGTSPSTTGTFTVKAGTTLLLHVTSPTTAASCSTTPYTNTATITTTNGGNSSPSATVTVNCPSGTPTKTADAATVNAGQQIGFKITVPNGGPGDLTGVTLSDSLPTGSGLNWSLDTSGSTIPSGISCTISGTAPAQQTLTCGTSPSTTGTFTVKAGTTLLLHVTSPTVGGATCTTTTYTNTVNITTGNGGNANPQAMTTVNCPSGTPTKTADAATVNAGQQIGFKITIPNSGPGDLTSVTLNDPLPLASGFNWSLDTAGSTIPSGISCAVSGTAPAQQTLSCGTSPSTTGTFTVKAGTTLLLHVTSPTTAASCSTTPYTNTATITTGNGGNSSPSATVTVNCPSGTPTKTADAATVNAGQQIGFKITVPNGGPGDLTGATLSDQLPLASGLNWTLDTAGSTIPSGISCAISGTAPAQQTLTCGTSPSTTGTFTVKAGTTLLLHVTSPTVGGANCTTTTYTNTVNITTGNGGNANPQAQVTVNCPSGTPTKTADAATVNAGQQIGFKITVPNGGPGDLTGVTLSDQLPLASGLNWSLDTAGSTIPSGISCAISGTAPAQQTLSCGTSPSTTGTFTVVAGTTLLLHVTSPTVGGATCTTTTYTNTVNITTGNGGNANPQAQVTVNCPSGTPTKTADAATVNAGQQIGFKITIPNGGPGDLTGVTLNDPLPLASGFNWSLDTAGSTIPSGISCAISGTAPAQQTLSCGTSPSTTGTFTVKASTTLLLHVTSPTTSASCSTTPYTNTATITTTNGGNSSPSATVTVNCPSGTPTKTADAATVNAGQQIGFKITVPNGGPGDLTGATLSDQLPLASGLNWTLDTAGSTIPSGISCAISGTAPAQQTLTCGTSPSTTGTFTVKAGTTLLLHVTSPTVGGATCTTTTYTNTVNITTGNGGNANPQAQVTVNCPTPSFSKTADASSVNAGQTIGFKVKIANGGPGDLTNVTLSDPLPLASGFNWTLDTAGSTIPTGISCTISGTAPAQQTLTCGPSPSTTGTFTVKSGATLLLHVTSPTVGGATCTTTTYTNTANITTGNGGNGNPQAQVTVNCPHATPTKTADAAAVNAGQQIGFKITIANTGAGDLTGVTLSDSLPTGTGLNWSLDTAGSTIPSGISCIVSGTAPAQQTLTCGTSPSTTGTFTVKAGTTLLLHVTGPTVGGATCTTTTYTNTVNITTGNGGNANPQATVTVNCPSPSFSKTADASPVTAGQTIGFKVKIANGGPGQLTGVTLSDPLPLAGGLNWTLDAVGSTIPTGISCTISGTAPAQQTLTCGTSPSTTGTFTLNAGQTLLVHVTSPTTGATCATSTLTNTANITTGNGGNANPSASITVNCAILHVTKTACPQSNVVPGGILTYSIAFSNSGLGAASNSVLVDTLPATGVQVTSAGGGTVSGNMITWNLGTIAAGGSGSESIQVLVTAANGATLVNNVSLTSTSATATATDQTTTSVSNAGAITHGESNWLNASLLGLINIDPDQVSTVATPTAPQQVAGHQLGPINVLGLTPSTSLASLTLVSDQSNSTVTDQATSTATSTIANLQLLEGAIKADAIQAVSQSVATPTTASFNSTGSNFVNLSYLGPKGKYITLANVAPNTTITVYALGLLGIQKLANVTLYEQSGNSGLNNGLWSANGSVNMIDITLLQPLLGLSAGAEIVVGHAQSDATYPSGLACGTAANTVSGKAFTAYVNGTLLGQPLLNVIEGEADLPPTGGSNTNQVLGVTLPDVVFSGTAVNSTSGSTAQPPNATSSSTTQAVNLLGGLVTADAIDVSSTSQATGTSASTTFGSVCPNASCGPTCVSTAPCFVNLAVTVGTTHLITVNGTVAPNTTIAVPSNGGLILIVLNEQITSGDGTKNTSGTINAIHVYVLNGSGLLSAEVIVASAHSDAHHG